MDPLAPPEAAEDFLAAAKTEKDVAQLLSRGAFEGGFVLVGPDGQGKATLAYRLAGAILSGAIRLADTDPKTQRLIAAGAHPDLLVLQRTENEKTRKLRAEIDIETARRAIHKLHQTAASGHSVIIVDLADELNRAASNSLLKILEEPPKGACLLLLSRSTSKMLPTLTSRCRRIVLRPVADEVLRPWLAQKTGAEEDVLDQAVKNAGGAPGRALRLAVGEGQDAAAMAEGFLRAVHGRADLLAASRKFGGRNMERIAEEARDLVLARLRRSLTAEDVPDRDLSRRLAAYDRAKDIFAFAGTADATQTALTAGLAIRDALNGKARHVG